MPRPIIIIGFGGIGNAVEDVPGGGGKPRPIIIIGFGIGGNGPPRPIIIIGLGGIEVGGGGIPRPYATG